MLLTVSLLSQSALRDYSSQLSEDPVVKRHLDDLFKALLEQNLVRIIRPYSKVQVQHLAKLITLDPETVEREVSQMILDKKIAGQQPCRDVDQSIWVVDHALFVKFKLLCNAACHC